LSYASLVRHPNEGPNGKSILTPEESARSILAVFKATGAGADQILTLGAVDKRFLNLPDARTVDFTAGLRHRRDRECVRMNRGPRRTSAGSIDGGASLVWIGIVVLAALGAALPLELPRPRASTFDETLSGRAPFAPVGLAGKSMVNSWLTPR
jgi:hypothetical protein